MLTERLVERALQRKVYTVCVCVCVCARCCASISPHSHKYMLTSRNSCCLQALPDIITELHSCANKYPVFAVGCGIAGVYVKNVQESLQQFLQHFIQLSVRVGKLSVDLGVCLIPCVSLFARLSVCLSV